MSFDFVIPEIGINGDYNSVFTFYKRGWNINTSGGSTPPTPPSWQDIILAGNGSLTLARAKEDGLNYLKLFGGCIQRNLPDGYTEVDGITGDGDAYIDLDTTLDEDDEIEIVFKFSESTTGRNIFGSRASASSQNITVFFAGTANRLVIDFNNSDYSLYRLLNEISINTIYTLKISKNSRAIYQGDTLIAENNTACPDDISISSVYLFFASGSPAYQTKFNGTIYRCTIKGKRDVVSAVYNNTAGMYDRLSGTFFTNVGSGSFTAGNALVPVPTYPISIISNNGAIKHSANMANVNEQTALTGYYISAQGVVTADANNWIYQDFIPVYPNTTYTLTISASVYYVSISEYSTADNSGFIIRKAGSTGSNTTLTIITGSTTNYIRFGTNIDRAEVTLDRVLAINWMLNMGNTMAYQPYVDGGIYTDGTVETVQVISDNLIDLSAVTDGYYYDPQGNYTALSVTRLTDYIPIETGKDVKIYFKSLSSTSNMNVRINLFNSSKVWQSQEVLQLLPLADDTMTITPTYNGYIRVSGNYSGSAIVDWNTASITKSLGSATAEMLLSVGDYKDEQEVLTGAITSNVGIKAFNGTEDWQNISGYYNISKTYIGSNSVVLPASSTDIICTHYETISGVPNRTSVNVGGSYVNFRDDNISTLTDWKQWLADQYNAGFPVIIVYPLATPTTETVTAQPLTIQAGTNTIEITQASIDNLPLEVSYKGRL